MKSMILEIYKNRIHITNDNETIVCSLNDIDIKSYGNIIQVYKNGIFICYINKTLFKEIKEIRENE